MPAVLLMMSIHAATAKNMTFAAAGLLNRQCSYRPISIVARGPFIRPLSSRHPSCPFPSLNSFHVTVIRPRPFHAHLPFLRQAIYPGLVRSFASSLDKKPERHENIYTIPNILTVSRIIATPMIAYLILHQMPYLATGLLFTAGLTDVIDGWIARRYQLKSVVGTVIDPMADKFLMITLTGALAYTGAMPRRLYTSFPF